jgi:uncharacterized protein (TIRG00374 family)
VAVRASGRGPGNGGPPGALARRTPRQLALGAAVVAAVVLGLYVLVPRLAGLDETWARIQQGNPWWLAIAALLEGASYGGYVVLFRGVFVRPGSPIGWRESYQITLAGVAATRLFAAGGAGGIALTGWALTRSGMDRQAVVRGLTTFLVALYAVFMAALVLTGVGLRTGVLSGPAPFAITVLPALFGACVIVVVLAIAFLPGDLARRVSGRLPRGRRKSRLAAQAASVAAAIAGGVRGAIALVRAGNPALLGAVAWWGFDIGVLWACFHAFGQPPPAAVVVMAYFTGMLAGLLPIPGGVGGVEGGMIGAFLAFDVPGGLAVVAVLTYRAFAFWLPTIPGAIAYLQLRRTVSGWAAAEQGG